MPEELVTIGAYSTPQEAYLVQSVLDAFGVDTVLADDNYIRLNWLYSNILGGVKVRAWGSMAEEARAILDGSPQEDVAIPPDEIAVCPVCGSANTGLYLDRRAACLTWLLTGVPLIFPRLRNACNDCGRKWAGAV
jgi:hypothetical protein